MTLPKIRFQVSKPVLAGRESEYVQDALASGWISSSGAYIGAFEARVASFLGAEEGIAVCNGTAALHLACMGLGLGPGDEVIVPDLTYVASANAVAYCGARPVFADCDPKTWNLTRESVEAAWTSNTVGVIAVHLYGLAAPVDELAGLCRTRGAWLIEDCAEALGASLRGRKVGTYGDAAAFSFYGNKIVSTGEGGMVLARSAETRERIRRLRGQGADLARRYWHPVIGYNYRMTNVAAAIGVAQMEMVDYHVSERVRIGHAYVEQFSDLALAGELQLPFEGEDLQNVYWLFSVVVPHADRPVRDRLLVRLLEEFGVETRPFFEPMHRLPMYRSEDLVPNAEYVADRGVNLPTYSGLEQDHIEEIAEAFKEVLRG